MKNITYTLLFILISTSLFSQFEDEEIIGNNNTYGIKTDNIITPDIDQDGDLDIVFYSKSNSRICWSENTFPEDYFNPSKILLDSIYGIVYFTSGDIDHDGDIDFAYTDENDNSIYWMENQGNQIFSDPQEVSNNVVNITKFKLADLDDDDDLDIVSISFDDNKVSWFENIDGTSYGDEQVLSTNLSGPIDLGVEDLNNDEDVDIVVSARQSGEIVWYENQDGAGDFSAGNVIDILNDVRNIVVKDFDSDGYLDVLAGSYQDDQFVWYQNLGGFGLFSQSNFIVNYDGWASFDIADMDMDGDMDFLIGSHYVGTDQELMWYENNGGDVSNPRILYSRKTINFKLSDMNNDNQVDVVITPSAGLVYFKNTNDPDNFQGRTLEIPYESFCDLVVGDVNNDGMNDVFSASSNIILYKTLSEEPYQSQTITPITILGNTTVFHRIDLKDLDNDMDLDLIFCSQYSLTWYKNNGSGGFDFEAHIDNGEYNDFEVSDIDNDGDLDIVSTSLGISWWENINGSFTTEHEFYSWSSFDYTKTNVELADLDNDGDIDVVSAFQTSPWGVYWFENTDGQGSFSTPTILNDNLDCNHAKICDIDGDLRLDIIVNEYVGNFFWFKGAGDGTFDSEIEIPFTIPGQSFGGSSIGMDVGDIDLDGDLDILATESYTRNAFWLENTGSFGIFNEVNIIGQLSDVPYTSKLYDFSEDGDLDVFTGTVSNLSRVSYFENTSFMVSTAELEKENNSIIISPNPANESFSIQPSLSISTEVNYKLFNHQGVEVLKNREMVFPEDSIEVNVENFPSGLYILELEYDGLFVSKKIIIQK